MRQAALAAIGAYQRYVSPYKGFCCAYREHTGRASCSALGLRAIRRHGVIKGSAIARARLQRCGEVYRRCHPAAGGLRRAQRGDCDLGGCDLPCDSCDACDVGNCGDCSTGRKTKRRDDKR